MKLQKLPPKLKSNQEKFDDLEVNNACSVAPPNETEQKRMIQTLSLRIKEQIRIIMMMSQFCP